MKSGCLESARRSFTASGWPMAFRWAPNSARFWMNSLIAWAFSGCSRRRLRLTLLRDDLVVGGRRTKSSARFLFELDRWRRSEFKVCSAVVFDSLAIAIQEIADHAEPGCNRCAPRRYSRAFFPASLSRRARGRGATLQCGISRGGGRFLHQDRHLSRPINAYRPHPTHSQAHHDFAVCATYTRCLRCAGAPSLAKGCCKTQSPTP